MNAITRPLTRDDAPALARLVAENREFLAPWEPSREESWFTVAGQRTAVQAMLERVDQGTALSCVVLVSGEVVGRVDLSNVVRGAVQSCSIGYWIARATTGRGLATAAVGEMLRRAFDDLGLHRVEAATLPHNVASQRVLERNGFSRYGLAPQYVRIAGRWQDHVLFQVLDERMP